MRSRDESVHDIRQNRKDFEAILKRIQNSTRPAERESLALEGIRLATAASTGYYSSDVIENVFLEMARRHSGGILPSFRKNSFLHIMTECYAVGGHTRVVERWVELAAPGQIHSLLFTEKPHQSVPLRLDSAIRERDGQILRLPASGTLLQKGLELREIASKFEFVVLHVHMHDVVPLIAFGTEEFERPVILFNHADHRFWVGASVADVIAETRAWGTRTSRELRGIDRSVNLGIPVDLRIKDVDRLAARAKLGIPPEAKVLMTAGAPFKYLVQEPWNFLKVIRPLLDRYENSVLLAVGPDGASMPEWNLASHATGRRVRALGYKSTQDFYEIVAASDLAFDSFPMSGGTALADITCGGCPVLALDCPTGHLDYIKTTAAFCHTPDDLRRKADLLLGDTAQARENVMQVLSELALHNGREPWLCKLDDVYRAAGRRHRVHSFHSPTPSEVTDLDVYLSLNARNRRRAFGIPHLFDIYRYRDRGKLRFSISLPKTESSQ